MADSAFAARNRSLMHERNPYREQPPDFAQLARRYPDFARFVHGRSDGRVQLDWSDPQVCNATASGPYVS